MQVCFKTFITHTKMIKEMVDHISHQYDLSLFLYSVYNFVRDLGFSVSPEMIKRFSCLIDNLILQLLLPTFRLDAPAVLSCSNKLSIREPFIISYNFVVYEVGMAVPEVVEQG